MIVYLGSLRKVENLNKDSIVQSLSNDTDTIGIWLTSNPKSAKPYAKGFESVFENSETDFWDDGEPKVVQIDRPISGYIYKVYMDEPNLKIYESNTEDSYDLFMSQRDKYCDYFAAKNIKLTWKVHPILLNKNEANEQFRSNLIKQGYEGLLIKRSDLGDLYCLFSVDSLHIVDIVPIDELNN